MSSEINEGLEGSLNALREMQLRNMFPDGVSTHHNISVTPENYILEPFQRGDLENITSLLPRYVAGLARITGLSLINDTERRSNWHWKQVRKALDLESRFQAIIRDSRKYEGCNYEEEEAILSRDESKNNPLARVDIIEEVNTGRLMITGIEVGKPPSLGYGVLGSSMSEAPIGINMAYVLAEVSKEATLGIVVSELEKFYEVELCYLASVVASQGGKLVIIPERDLVVTRDGVTTARSKIEPITKLLSRPLLTGVNRTAQYTKDMGIINDLIARGVIDILSDRRPELSNKASMAILSNPNGDEWLESQLLRCIDSDDLMALRKYLTKTTYLPLIETQGKSDLIEQIRQGYKVFIKNRNMSGGHGIIPPDKYEDQISYLLKNNVGDVIIQEAVNPKWKSITAIDLRDGFIDTKDCTCRTSVFSWGGSITDICVTATAGDIAHGGEGSILMGVKIMRSTLNIKL